MDHKGKNESIIKNVYLNKSELAGLYNVGLKKLMKDIENNTSLWDELNDTDYNTAQKGFYPSQLEIIFKYFGDPRSSK